MTSKTEGQTHDYVNWSNTRLITRVTELERLLRAHTTQLQSHPAKTIQNQRKADTSRNTSPKLHRAFDPSKYNTRFIALKFAYLGQRYGGYEHHNGNETPLPAVEEVLWKALRKAYLISPNDVQDGVDHGREISWEGVQYSKCGRTDKGVSAFGQVVGIRVRSRRPVQRVTENGEVEESDDHNCGKEERERQYHEFDDIADDLPYVQILNKVLPPDIRVLAWCPSPPPNFDARFSCRERRYRYFFTQPAFAPTPGLLGFKRVPGSKYREGWLDIEAMRDGARRLIGLHDFRNFCKVDPSKQMKNFERRIFHADIELVDVANPTLAYVEQEEFRALHGQADTGIGKDLPKYDPSQPQIFTFTVHGSAFLWHQVRCMVAILFLIGQGLEAPSVVSDLLDVKTNPQKPNYEMAVDAPLVLWDCIFPAEDSSERVDCLDWVYAGDTPDPKALKKKNDGKFGLGGVAEELWKTWRQRKIDEILAGSLLDLVVSQGNSGEVGAIGSKVEKEVLHRSQRIFEGRDGARLTGAYVPVMKRPPLESVETQNAKFLAKGKGRLRPENGSD